MDREKLVEEIEIEIEKLQGIMPKKRIGVYTGRRSYMFNGVEVLPVEEFFNSLYDGKIF